MANIINFCKVRQQTVNSIREDLVEEHIRNRLSEADIDIMTEQFLGTPTMLQFVLAMRDSDYQEAFRIYEAMLRGSLRAEYFGAAEREFLNRKVN